MLIMIRCFGVHRTSEKYSRQTIELTEVSQTLTEMWTIDEVSRARVFKKGVILGGGRAANYIRLSGLGRLAVLPKLLPLIRRRGMRRSDSGACRAKMFPNGATLGRRPVPVVTRTHISSPHQERAVCFGTESLVSGSVRCRSHLKNIEAPDAQKIPK